MARFGTLQEGSVSLPVGKVYGVRKGAEFTASTTSKIIVSISHIDDHESKANVVSGSVQDRSKMEVFAAITEQGISPLNFDLEVEE